MTEIINAKGIVRDHFDSYAPSWHDRLRQHPFRSRYLAVGDMIQPLAKGRVLDIGCGTGDYSNLFDLKKVEYLGIDLAPVMIHKARDLYPQARFEVGDGDHIPVENGYADLVLDIAVIEYYDDPVPHLRELRRTLKPGGYAVVAGPNGSNATKAPAQKVANAMVSARKAAGMGTGGYHIGNPNIRHRARTLDQIRDYASKSGFSVAKSAYVDLLLVPLYLRPVTHLNAALSTVFGNNNALVWLSRPTARSLICLLRAE